MAIALGYRNVRTKNEKTQFYAASDNELGIRVNVRRRRQANCLPNPWDDCYYHYAQRSWKKFRKTQWKKIIRR